MSSISLFTPVSFEAGSQGCTQSTLSLLSNYFNIGEEHAVVVKGQDPAALAQKVKLVKDAPSTLIVALKIASYILLLPLALILFVAKCALQSQYTFTIEKAEKPEKKTPRKKKDPPPASPPSSRGSSPTPTGSPHLSSPPSHHSGPPSPHHSGPHSHRDSPPPRGSPPPLGRGFSGTLTRTDGVGSPLIEDANSAPITKIPELRITIGVATHTQQEISAPDAVTTFLQQQVASWISSHQNVSLQLYDYSSHGSFDRLIRFFTQHPEIRCERDPQRSYFIQISPKIATESTNESGVKERHFSNGVIEKEEPKEREIDPFFALFGGVSNDWKGTRTFPNGTVQEGTFNRLSWELEYGVEARPDQRIYVRSRELYLTSQLGKFIVDQGAVILVETNAQLPMYCCVKSAKDPIALLASEIQNDPQKVLNIPPLFTRSDTVRQPLNLKALVRHLLYPSNLWLQYRTLDPCFPIRVGTIYHPSPTHPIASCGPRRNHSKAPQRKGSFSLPSKPQLKV